MDIFFAIFIVIFFIVVFVLAVKQLKNNNFSNKSTIVKKSEIIDGYKQRLDSVTSKEEKSAIIKDINSELAMNIFFDQDELKQTMQELIAYSIK